MNASAVARPRRCMVVERRPELRERVRAARRVHQSRSRKTVDLAPEHTLIDTVREDDDRRGSGSNDHLEPVDPLVRNPAIDDLGEDHTDASAENETDDPADRPSNEETEQARPHRANDPQSPRLGVDGLANAHTFIAVLDHQHRVDKTQPAIHAQPRDRKHELLRPIQRVERQAEQRLVSQAVTDSHSIAMIATNWANRRCLTAHAKPTARQLDESRWFDDANRNRESKHVEPPRGVEHATRVRSNAVKSEMALSQPYPR